MQIKNNKNQKINLAKKIEYKNVYTKFLGSLIKKGNKNAAKRALDSSFIKVSQKHKTPLHRVFSKIFSKLTCRLEMKKVKMRRNTHLVPFPIRTGRQDFLKIKWILKAVKEDIRKVSFSEKMSVELLDVLINKKSKILMQKKLINKEALLNRSNVHYR